MPRSCTICTHPARGTIEHALQAGRSLRPLAAQWSVSKTALIRHKQDHLLSQSRPAAKSELSARLERLETGIQEMNALLRLLKGQHLSKT